MVGLAALLVLAQQFPVTVIDDRGEEITIESRPERIVVAGTTLYIEILLDIGAGDRIVGVAGSPDNPPEVQDLPQIGPSYSPSVETILALEPDLVLGAWGEVRDRLEEAGITVLTVGRPGGYIASISDILAAIRTVGTAVGNLGQADELIGRIAEEIVEVEGKVLGLEPVRAAFLYMGAPDTPPYASGSGSIENELILRAGGVNVFADVSGFPQVSLEEVLARDPQVIFTDPAQVENIRQSQLLQGVTAVQGGKVYGIKASATVSTRVAETLRLMAGVLHPEAFSGEE
jgi:iron complex transport system substrate-binding protein